MTNLEYHLKKRRYSEEIGKTLLTAHEACKIIGWLSDDAVRKRARRGDIKEYKVGRLVFFDKEEIQQFAKDNPHTPKPIHRPKSQHKCNQCKGKFDPDDLTLFRKKYWCRDCLCPPLSDEEIADLAHSLFGLKSSADMDLYGGITSDDWFVFARTPTDVKKAIY